MATIANYGLEQARIQLPSIIANAHAGSRSIITKHGKPCAAIVPRQDIQKTSHSAELAAGILSLRGTGRGLWGTHVGQTVSDLRDEWSDIRPIQSGANCIGSTVTCPVPGKVARRDPIGNRP